MIECPTCGAPMVSRKNRESGQRFWGCSKFPACRGTRDTDGEPPRDKKHVDDNDERYHRDRYDAEQRGAVLPSERRRSHDRRRWE